MISPPNYYEFYRNNLFIDDSVSFEPVKKNHAYRNRFFYRESVRLTPNKTRPTIPKREYNNYDNDNKNNANDSIIMHIVNEMTEYIINGIIMHIVNEMTEYIINGTTMHIVN